MLKEKYNFCDLVEIMELLRSENGCPWDKEQTHESLKRYLIEETYEVLEAIDMQDGQKTSEELGDLLLQVVFHSQVAKEEGTFDIEDVITGICKKMISRHTHIFGDDKAETSERVLDNWEKIKKAEKGHENQTDVLKHVPANLPALMRAYKVQQKAAQVGFDWDNINDVISKIYEELEELKEVQLSSDIEKISDELGDVLFSVVNLARFLKAHPELALTGTINKFIRRFEYVETKSLEAGRFLQDMTLSEMDDLWKESKSYV